MSSFNQQLKKYSLAAGAIAAGSGSAAYGSIVYHNYSCSTNAVILSDLLGDSSTSSSVYLSTNGISLNSAGTADELEVQAHTLSLKTGFLLWEDSSSVLMGPGMEVVTSYTTPIDSNLGFSGGTLLTSTDSTNAFLALEFDFGGNETYYGWAEIAATADTLGASVEIRQMAFNNEAGKSIMTGDTGEMIPEPAVVTLLAMAGGAGLFARRMSA